MLTPSADGAPAIAWAILVAAATPLAGCLTGAPGQFLVPPLTDAFTVEADAGGGETISIRTGGPPKVTLGAFDQVFPCLPIIVQNEQGYESEYCFDHEQSQIVTEDVLLEGTSSLGQGFPAYVQAFQPGFRYLGPLPLAGRNITEGEAIHVAFNGATITYEVVEASTSGARVRATMRLDRFEPDQHQYGRPVTWERDDSVYEFTLKPDGPLANQMSFVSSGKTKEIYHVSSQSWDGAPLLVGHAVPACHDCQPRPLSGPGSGSATGGSWGLEKALADASVDPAVRDFLAGQDVVVGAAHYSVRSNRGVGLLVGGDTVTENWSIRTLGPARSQSLVTVLERTSSDSRGRLVERSFENATYHLPKAAWPAELHEPSIALQRIFRAIPDGRLIDLYFNGEADPTFFGEGGIPMFTTDTGQRHDLSPDFLVWTLVVESPDGGADSFDYSAVNGQWLAVPARYLEAFGVSHQTESK